MNKINTINKLNIIKCQINPRVIALFIDVIIRDQNTKRSIYIRKSYVIRQK